MTLPLSDCLSIALDYLKAWNRRCFLKDGQLRAAAAKEEQSRILNLPLDVLFLIRDVLPLESLLALSLTCKTAFGTFFPSTPVSGRGLARFLLLLEKDVSHQLFYCHTCGRLHRFSRAWSPGSSQYPSEGPSCCDGVIYPILPIGIHFHHAQLVMNEHFYGHKRGLGLEQMFTSLSRIDGWRINSSARIIRNRLFVCLTHKLLIRESRGGGWEGLSSLRGHHICRHTATLYRLRSWSLLEGTITTAVHDPRARYLDEHHQIPGSCPICLTDYHVTLERNPIIHVPKKVMKLTIVSYHELGTCRSPSDWKWHTYATMQPLNGIITRQESSVPPGAIRELWHMNPTMKTYHSMQNR
ncbi:hypothetical protein GGR52DRAFT_441599 [Hypoxylon sp. FL1284]|nr:hypothetical protein GGR52DRAFT_441599 [Hypoxylon sp. FL1284]